MSTNALHQPGHDDEVSRCIVSTKAWESALRRQRREDQTATSHEGPDEEGQDEGGGEEDIPASTRHRGAAAPVRPD